jgi:feruloyl esterase
MGPVLDSTEADLSAFKGLGGKLIMYHGWLDQNIAPRNSIVEEAQVPTPSTRSRHWSSGWRRTKLRTRSLRLT